MLEQIQALGVGSAGCRKDQRGAACVGDFTPEVASHLTFGLDCFHHRHSFLAQRTGMRASGMKTAARRRAAGAGHIAAEQGTRLAQVRVADWHSGHQRLGVRVIQFNIIYIMRTYGIHLGHRCADQLIVRGVRLLSATTVKLAPFEAGVCTPGVDVDE